MFAYLYVKKYNKCQWVPVEQLQKFDLLACLDDEKKICLWSCVMGDQRRNFERPSFVSRWYVLTSFLYIWNLIIFTSVLSLICYVFSGDEEEKIEKEKSRRPKVLKLNTTKYAETTLTESTNGKPGTSNGNHKAEVKI